MAQLISFNQDPSVLAKSKGLFEAQLAEDGTILVLSVARQHE